MLFDYKNWLYILEALEKNHMKIQFKTPTRPFQRKKEGAGEVLKYMHLQNEFDACNHTQSEMRQLRINLHAKFKLNKCIVRLCIMYNYLLLSSTSCLYMCN